MKPNFFLIGAPKAGTSAMSEYLRSHPEVFFSDPKEPHFFNTDFRNRHTRTLQSYESIFASVGSRARVIGEGSIFYMASDVAVANILEYQPQAKFGVMLRHPVEMAHAWHSEALRNFGESETDFESAWRLQEERRQGRAVPRFCDEVKTLMYGDLCRLGGQLERLYERVDRDRVFVCFFDDFARDPGAAYRRCLQFLGICDDHRLEFPVVNANREVISPRLEHLISCTGRAWRDLRPRLGITVRLGAADWLRRLNRRRTERRQLGEEFIRELMNYFQTDIELLQRLTGRNLSGWLR